MITQSVLHKNTPIDTNSQENLFITFFHTTEGTIRDTIQIFTHTVISPLSYTQCPVTLERLAYTDKYTKLMESEEHYTLATSRDIWNDAILRGFNRII